MKKKTFAILFYVKRTKLLRNGKATIFMRITVDAVRTEMSIQRSINLIRLDREERLCQTHQCQK